ncbi:hypothetical protein [Streptantibioticus silvisoli]|uniref:Uncharacterized protein n=1 Tax=Streptantibioticus silvisoli TaxID=2705255 RepID=A0ABT6W4Y4_9ACTN|nr:hypothetical protein [Streptantibioticus silvisoli]MDI5965813.1 hypothetical protein [Streptantibioticus silvisoli]
MTHRNRAAHTLVRHQPIADALREVPGLELPVGTYSARHNAKNVAYRIIHAYRLPYYEPAGSYTARCEDTEMGTAVYARYVGERAAIPNAA